MNILLPYKWIKEYLKTELSAEEFAKQISLGGPSIEKWDYSKELDDSIFDIEITPNRADMASVIGVAREASAILPTELLYKEPKIQSSKIKELPYKVTVNDFELCPRYQSIVIDGITVKDSPEWMTKRLKAAGLNSINNIVDITNYVLLEYGQPVHAFDYDKLSGNEIIVRKANNGEIFESLDNKSYKLDDSMLVICDEQNPIGLAGIKGGLSSGITNFTKRIVIEVANFNPISIRKTWRKLDLRTDASNLFEKGLNVGLTEPAINRVIELILELAGGEMASDLMDVKQEDFSNKIINFDPLEIDRLLGIKIPTEDIVSILNRLGFTCELVENLINVTVPYYRNSDIEFDYDLVEEIARIYGYHKIQGELPTGQLPALKMSDDLILEDKVKDILANQGFVETITYPMISKKQLDVSNFSEDSVLKVANPLTTDFVYMRRDLASSLIEIASRNETYEPVLELFNLDKVYIPNKSNELPTEQLNLSILVNNSNANTSFYNLKGIWEYLLETIGLDKDKVEYNTKDVNEPFKVGSTASIYFEGTYLGSIGLLSKNAVQMFGLKKPTALLEVDFDEMIKIILKAVKSYTPIPRYPSVKRDLAFVLEKSVQWKSIKDVVKTTAGELLKDIELFDMFEDTKLGDSKKSIAFHVTLQSEERTLKDEEVAEVMSKISTEIQNKFKALERV